MRVTKPLTGKGNMKKARIDTKSILQVNQNRGRNMTKSFKEMSLSTSEAIVLQQLQEDGEDDMSLLSSQLGFSKGRIVALINGLKQKGLLVINHDYKGTWIRLSTKGNHLISYMWPEMQMRYA